MVAGAAVQGGAQYLVLVEEFEAAMARLGVLTAKLALKWWNALDKGKEPDWGMLSELIGPTMIEARELAVAFYRLASALAIGSAPRHPWAKDSTTTVNMGQLIADFEQAARVKTGLQVDRNKTINVTSLESKLAYEKIRRAEANEMRRGLHSAIGRKITPEGDEIPETAAKTIGSWAEKAVYGAARQTVTGMTGNDKNAIGWARVSSTGHPCHWCALLIARGAWYLSKESGENQSDKAKQPGHEYHPNCHCEAVPVFSKDQYYSDPTFQDSRKYYAIWKRWAEDKNTVESRSVKHWRAYFDEHNGFPGYEPEGK